MKTLVIYDTSYGNTSRVAEAIARGLGGGANLGL
jgi:flavodoxin